MSRVGLHCSAVYSVHSNFKQWKCLVFFQAWKCHVKDTFLVRFKFIIHIVNTYRCLVVTDDDVGSQLYYFDAYICLPVWRHRVRRLATDPVVMRSSPATGHNIRYALLANQHK